MVVVEVAEYGGLKRGSGGNGGGGGGRIWWWSELVTENCYNRLKIIFVPLKILFKLFKILIHSNKTSQL